MVKYEKAYVLPPYDMNRKFPLKSWYTIPLFLSANAPIQNTFAIASSPLSPIRFGRFVAWWIGCGCSTICCTGSWFGTSWTGYLMTGTVTMSLFVWCFGRVLLIPCLGHFMCPLAIAVLGFRYLRVNLSVGFGHPFMNPFLTTFKSVDIFGFPRD